MAIGPTRLDIENERRVSEHKRRYMSAAIDIVGSVRTSELSVSGVLTYGVVREDVERPGVDTLDMLFIFPDVVTDKLTLRRVYNLLLSVRERYRDVPTNVSIADLVTLPDGRFSIVDTEDVGRKMTKGLLAVRKDIKVRQESIFRCAEPTNVGELLLRRRLRDARRYLFYLDEVLCSGDNRDILLAQYNCIESTVFVVGMLSDVSGVDQSRLLQSEPLSAYSADYEKLVEFYGAGGVDLERLAEVNYRQEVVRNFEYAVTYLEAAIATYLKENPRKREILPPADSVEVAAQSPVDDLFGDLDEKLAKGDGSPNTT